MKMMLVFVLLALTACTKSFDVQVAQPVINNLSLNRFITADDFRTSKMRGFNFSTVHSLTELKAKNIPAAKATGANVGRYWITISHDAYNNYYFSNSSGTNLGTTPLTTLDSAIKIAEKTGMYLVVTLNVLPDQGKCDLWGNTTRKEGVKKIWQKLATRYKDKKIIAAYDLINEPRINTTTKAGSVKEYIDWQISVINAIRLIDPYHVIAVEVLGNSMLGDAYMASITPIKNLIYSPHGYSPLSLTHQGVSTFLGGTDIEQRQTYPSVNYPANYFLNKSYWKVIKDFKTKYNKPIWIGEFSCINWAGKNSLGEWTSTRWINDVIKLYEAEGWSWCYHSWREWQGWDGEISPAFYTTYTYKNGAPFTSNTKPAYFTWTQRSSTAPTITMLKKYFYLNKAFY
jgi:endoglucanase